MHTTANYSIIISSMDANILKHIELIKLEQTLLMITNDKGGVQYIVFAIYCNILQ